jgi:predicted Zn-dependent peptidase
MQQVKKVQLRNGLRIILVPMSHSLAATALVLVEAGSEYETKRINGLSHFLEHMCFKGTARRPRAGQIAEELEALGAESNAFTDREDTGYWAKVRSDKLPDILELVGDLYLNPIFNPEEIDKERGVIIEEINLYEDTPSRRVHDIFASLMYGDQPAGWDIGGRKDVIRKLTRDDFLAYRRARYIAPSTVVVVAGGFDVRKTMGAAARLFGALPRRKKIAKLRTKLHQKRPAIRVHFKESDQSHLVIGMKAFSVFDKRRYALQLLAHALGGGMSSRLFKKVREELGAAYYVRAHTELLLDHGSFSVSSGINHAKVNVVVPAILGELRRMRDELISPKELKKVKDHFIGGFLLGLETSDGLAGFYGGQEILTGKFVSPKDVIAKINAVTAEQIRAVAHSLFIPSQLNLAVIGPYRKEAPLRKMLKF